MVGDDETQTPPGTEGVVPEAGAGAPGAPPGAAEAPGPEEEELRRRLEQELRKLRVGDLLLQSVVSLINLTSRRIAKPDERDLDQARVGIEAIRALVDLIDAEPAAQVREALSQLQVAYAREAGTAAPGEGEGASQAGQEKPAAPASAAPKAAEGKPPSGLWTPHDRG